MQTNLEWFRTFKAIYETGTLSGAAGELNISQPGVSLHLNSLESYTGYKLFDRTARKMIPTEKGKMLYNFILEPILKLETAERQFMKKSEKERVTISLGMCFETFQYTLEEYIPGLPFNLIIKFGDYPSMLRDLGNGLLDLIVTPQKGNDKGTDFEPFSKERILLIAGGSTDLAEVNSLIATNKLSALSAYLKQQIWYSTAADMEHHRRFWMHNFGEHPDFRPNYIVPNISSIIRCLSHGKGFAVVPDFLCRESIDEGKLKSVWEGKTPLENILYFGSRKNTIYKNEIEGIQRILKKKWENE